MMLKEIQNIFVQVTGMDEYIVTPKTRLDKKNEYISSLTQIQLICEIEDAFDVEIPNSVIKKMKTVNDLLRFLEKNSPS